MSMQDRIMKELKWLVESKNCEFLTEFSYSNCGKIYITKGFSNILNIHCDFQHNYCKFQVYDGENEPIATCGFTHEKCILNKTIDYHRLNEVKELLDYIKRKLNEKTK